MLIPIYKPYLKKYKSSALKAINDEWISNYGINVTNATKKIQEILNVKYCILMNNGTATTHCLFLALKYKHPQINKIYIPNNVFVAPWNCCLTEYPKEKLEVMKIDHKTLNIDTSEKYIKSLDKNSCVLIVHNLGNIVNVPRLKRLRPDLIFVEDNCEGLFGKYENIYSGTSEASLCSSASFYANKTITTGEGGAFFTNDEKIYKYILKIYSHGMTNERYVHDSLAYNYRMTNIQAGFLYDQLLDIDEILKMKNDVFKYYNKLIEEDNILKAKTIKIVSEKNTVRADWMYGIILQTCKYKDIEKNMTEKGVETRPFFFDINKHEHLKDIKHNYNTDIVNYGIILPSYPELTIDEQKYIINCLKDCIL